MSPFEWQMVLPLEVVDQMKQAASILLILSVITHLKAPTALVVLLNLAIHLIKEDQIPYINIIISQGDDFVISTRFT